MKPPAEEFTGGFNRGEGNGPSPRKHFQLHR